MSDINNKTKRIAQKVLKRKKCILDKKNLNFNHKIPQNFVKLAPPSEAPYLMAGGYILRSVANQGSFEMCLDCLNEVSYKLASQKLRDESLLYRVLLHSFIERGDPYSSALIKLLNKEYLDLGHRFMKSLDDYLEDIKITMNWKEREQLVYEHNEKDNLRYLRFKSCEVLVKYDLIADVGFSGYSKTPLGFVKEKASQKDDKKGTQITKLEKLSNEEEEEVRESLSAST